MNYTKAVLTCLVLLHGIFGLESIYQYGDAAQLDERDSGPFLSKLYMDSGEAAAVAAAAAGGGGEASCGNESPKGKQCGNFDKGNPKSKASNIAQKAAQEAKAASDSQMAAAEAAATQVKSELAERAAQSARAAEAALAGKQQIVEQLEQELAEAEAVVTEVTSSLQNTQANNIAAAAAAADSQTQVEHIKLLLQAATSNLANIEGVSQGAQTELSEKTQLLEAAKNRVQSLNKQMTEAKSDFEKTKQAAYKAACAAVEAKKKAQRMRRMAAYRQWMIGQPGKYPRGGAKM
ncbi:tol-Pal system protein TolA [Drosophila obscura]|uniref:tol-Pal system protein TolA n=1 Tax=Drosophila obscura TaxID=7282 RepID=UPI001BB281CF|nr:tol-Pal system protein TolA [Drosophila obscura]